MSARSLPSPLLAVTDRHGPRPLGETIAAVLDGGCRWVWFRDRDLPPPERGVLAERIAERVREAGGVLSVGGDLELAAALGASVHLGGGTDRTAIADARRRLGTSALVGVSAHGLRDVEAAEDADYVTLSPVFATASKPGYGPALGLGAIATAARIGIPVVALGGIGVATAAACRRAGAAGVAVMGGLMRVDDPSAEARALLRGWEAASDGPP
ncbi:thiamine phosphate synthase [Methylobacterium sp. E-016]|nr:thiamine phosphate synthase [Methylobacterium sp. E-016]